MPQEVLPLGLGDNKARPRLRAVGIGGAGCNAISSCSFDAVALCNAQDSFHSAPHHRKVVLTAEHIGFIRSISPRLLSNMEHDSVHHLKDALGESDLLFLFTGLGGETGSHLAPGIAHFARRSSGLVVVSAALPFSVEGPGRRETAARALPEIMQAAHATITYPNDGLLRLTPNLPLRKAFRVMDSIMMFPATELAQVITRDDLTAMRADLSSVRHLRLGIGEGTGIRREELAVMDAFASPWFDLPTEKVTLAVAVLSGTEMDQFAIKAVLDRLLPRIPNARVRYATRTDPIMGDRVRLMLLLGYGP